LSLDDEMEIPAEETGAEETGDVDVTPMNTDAEVAMDEEPEEEYEFQGEKMLQELANRLGSEVENNMINYNGKKIEFYSETEAFAIDRKGKYKNVDEVISKLEQ
jgi:HD superfamily phosphodiesterase